VYFSDISGKNGTFYIVTLPVNQNETLPVVVYYDPGPFLPNVALPDIDRLSTDNSSLTFEYTPDVLISDIHPRNFTRE
jgi:hypothetical protein